MGPASGKPAHAEGSSRREKSLTRTACQEAADKDCAGAECSTERLQEEGHTHGTESWLDLIEMPVGNVTAGGNCERLGAQS